LLNLFARKVFSDADPCLSIQDRGKKKIFLTLYIDDDLVAGIIADDNEIDELITTLKEEFKITTGPLDSFLKNPDQAIE